MWSFVFGFFLLAEWHVGFWPPQWVSAPRVLFMAQYYSSVYPLVRWQAFGLFPHSDSVVGAKMRTHAGLSMFSMLWATYLRVGCCHVVIQVNILRNCQTIFQSSCTVWGFQFLQIFANTCCMAVLATPVDVKWSLFVLLIYIISLVINSVDIFLLLST